MKSIFALDFPYERFRGWMRRHDVATRVLGYAIAAVGIALTLMFFLTIFAPIEWFAKDGVTYLAAAERLNAGHALYSLEPGDRLVAGFGTDCCPFPLMSPPTIAVLWRPIALLGPEAALLTWDWVNAVAIIATVGLLLVRIPLATGIFMVLLSLPLAQETLLGNVNGILLAGVAATWFLGRTGRFVLAGAVIAVMAAIKLWPAVLLVWFLTQGHHRALKGFLAGGMVMAGTSLVGAGLMAHLDYLATVVPATTGQAPLATIVRAATGVDVPWIGYAVLGAGIVEVWALRERPRLAWATAVLAMVLGSPVFHVGTLVLLFGALLPWAEPARAKVQPSADGMFQIEP
jgi:hypothetical protein